MIAAEYGHRRGFGEVLQSFPNNGLCELSASVSREQRIKNLAYKAFNTFALLTWTLKNTIFGLLTQCYT